MSAPVKVKPVVVIEPESDGDRKVTGSLKVTSPFRVISPLLLSRPMMMVPVNFASSVLFRKAASSPPISRSRLGVNGCTSSSLPVTKTLSSPTSSILSAVRVILPLPESRLLVVAVSSGSKTTIPSLLALVPVRLIFPPPELIGASTPMPKPSMPLLVPVRLIFPPSELIGASTPIPSLLTLVVPVRLIFPPPELIGASTPIPSSTDETLVVPVRLIFPPSELIGASTPIP